MKTFLFFLTFGIERPHVPGPLSIEGSDLDLVIEDSVRIPLKEQFIDGHVQGGDHLLGVADHLPVEVLVELLDVRGIDV